MSERRELYLAAVPSRWIDIRFNDGKHTGLRVLSGTTVIEIKRDGRKMVVDIVECMPIDLAREKVYDK